jgi:tripartite-type tricarboxylate transporter receptor subunit TctC
MPECRRSPRRCRGSSPRPGSGPFCHAETPQWIAVPQRADLNEALKVAASPGASATTAANRGTTPPAAAAFVQSEVERWKTVIKAAGIKLE